MPLSDYPHEQQKPISLSAEEMENPLVVFQQFFEFSHLPEIRETIGEIKQWIFNKNYPHASDSIGHDNTIYFFERLVHLIEASYMLAGIDRKTE